MKYFIIVVLALMLTGCRSGYDQIGRQIWEPVPVKIAVFDTEVFAIHRPADVEIAHNDQTPKRFQTKSAVAIIEAIATISKAISDCFKWTSHAREIGAQFECNWSMWYCKLVTIEWGWDKYYLESKEMLMKQHKEYLDRDKVNES